MSIQSSDAADTFSAGYLASGDDEDAFKLVHQNGDTIALDNTKVVVRDASGGVVATFDSENSYQFDSDSAPVDLVLKLNGAQAAVDDSFSAGDTLVIAENADTEISVPLSAGTEYNVKIIHVASGSTVVNRTITLN
jgi:hypothetical protein